MMFMRHDGMLMTTLCQPCVSVDQIYLLPALLGCHDEPGM